MSLVSPALQSAIGWTLVHFLWQGALLACATAAALAALRNAGPQSRYAVCCTALLLCVLWPGIDLCARLASGDAVSVDGGVTARFLASERMARTVGLLGWLQMQLAWIVAFWAACAGALALRMLAGLIWIERLAGAPASNPALQSTLSALALRLGVKRAVRLSVVDTLASPVTAGWWRPVVLVPASLVTGMPLALLEALLAHEMAHVKRLDYLVNLVQNVVEIVLFYHPAVWWISGRIRIEREQIADDIAAAALGEPRRLALALSELERLQFAAPHLTQAANGGELMSRIARLVRPGRQALGWTSALPLLGMAAACLSLFMALPGWILSVADEGKHAPTTAAPPPTLATIEAANTRRATVPDAPPKAIRIVTRRTPVRSKQEDAADLAMASPRLAAVPPDAPVRTAARIDFSSCAQPVYPSEALRKEYAGRVTIGFLIGKEGEVLDSRILASSGHTELDDAALTGIGKCRFRPATNNGEPAESWMRMQYVWTPGPAASSTPGELAALR